MYKEASRLKLRFETTKGSLNTEQLWTLSKNQLSVIVRNLKKQLNGDSDDELAFLDDGATQVDKKIQLMFDIAKDIYLTKKSELNSQASLADVNREEQELLAIAAEQERVVLRNDPALLQKRLEEIQKKKSELK